MVWELEGPMPTLKMSKTLKLMTTNPAAPAGSAPGLARGSLQRARAAHMLCGDLRGLKCDQRRRLFDRHGGRAEAFGIIRP